MKKIIRLVSLLFLCVLLIFSFCACTGHGSDVSSSSSDQPFVPQNAAELWQKTDEVMSGLSSFQSTTTMEMLFYYYGNKIESTGSYSTVFAENGDFTMGHYMTVSEDLELDETEYFTEAYYDGKMYLASSNGTNDQKICAVTSYEDYMARPGESISDRVDYLDCSKSVLTSNDDGSWTAKFSGYTKKSVEDMLDSLSFGDRDMGATIHDMEITVCANKDFYATKMEIGFTFEEDENIPESPKLYSYIEFSKYNEAAIDVSVLKPEDYKEVDSVILLSKLEETIKEKQDADSGKFMLEIKDTVKVYGQSTSQTEKDVITYGRKNGAYFYEVDGKINNQKVVIKYQNGSQVVEMGGEKYSNSQSMDDAKAFVDNLINGVMFNKSMVSDVKKQEDGTYLLTVPSYDMSAANEANASIGLKYNSGTQEITVFLGEDGSISKVVGTVKAKGKYQGETVNLTTKVTIDFGVAE